MLDFNHPATFPIVCKIMGLSPARLAHATGVRQRSAERWLSGHMVPPVGIQAECAHWWEAFLARVNRLSDDAESRPAHDPLILATYQSEGAYRADYPDVEMDWLTYEAVIRAVIIECELNNIPVHVSYGKDVNYFDTV